MTRKLLAAATALAFAAFLYPSTAHAAGQGNSAAAKACQKNGYQSLATAETPRVAFTSSTACTSYAAKGGTLTPLQVGVDFTNFAAACLSAPGYYDGYLTTFGFYECVGAAGVPLSDQQIADLANACTSGGGFPYVAANEADNYVVDCYPTNPL